MATAVATAGEVMRVVLPPELKEEFRAKCIEHGQKMSERTRQLIAADVSQGQSASSRLSGILASARKKNDSNGLPEPTIEDIDAFIDAVRSERIAEGFVA